MVDTIVQALILEKKTFEEIVCENFKLVPDRITEALNLRNISYNKRLNLVGLVLKIFLINHISFHAPKLKIFLIFYLF